MKFRFIHKIAENYLPPGASSSLVSSHLTVGRAKAKMLAIIPRGRGLRAPESDNDWACPGQGWSHSRPVPPKLDFGREAHVVHGTGGSFWPPGVCLPALPRPQMLPTPPRTPPPPLQGASVRNLRDSNLRAISSRESLPATPPRAGRG